MATLQKNYVFPLESPLTKQEITEHFQNAEKQGYGMSFSEYNAKIERWLNEH
jgi:hypothetical protein